jgi:hypothetical protein
MSSPTAPITATIWEDEGLFLMARVLGNAGTAITQASLTAITYGVYDVATGTATVTAGTALTISSVVFNTYQVTAVDPRWTLDTTGYNFATSIPASAFPTGGATYQVEILFDPASGENFWLVARVTAKALFTS